MLKPITSPEALAERVEQLGFLPLFRCCVPGLSVEEMTPRELWFAPDTDGPWEWKGPVLRTGRCAYGKLFRGKCGFVSLDWLPDLANARRGGYDFDARAEDGLVSWHAQRIYAALEDAGGSLLSRDLKEACGYGREGLRGFDQTVTQLQMQTYLCVQDFEYALDKHGKPYGWGLSRLTTPERLYGAQTVTAAYRRDPADSLARCAGKLKAVLPDAEEKLILRLLRG